MSATTAFADFATIPSLDYRPTFAEPEQFLVFVRMALPGEQFVYATACNLGRDNQDGASPTPDLAWRAHREGWVRLVQRRLGPMKFAYIAVRRARVRRVALQLPKPHWHGWSGSAARAA